MNRFLIPLASGLLATTPLVTLAEATFYGQANVSVDYLDVDPHAAWGRPAGGGPGFDVLSFIHEGNRILNEAGYQAALPPPRDLDTVIGDLLFGTIPFASLDPAVQQRILEALDRALVLGHSYRGWDLNATDRGSRIGIRGSEALSPDLKVIYQIEFGVPLAHTDNWVEARKDTSLYMRDTWLGLSSNAWGNFLVGRHDTPLKLSTLPLDLFHDTLADYRYTVGFEDIRGDNSLFYLSPSLWGLRFAGATLVGGGANFTGSYDPAADSLASGWSTALIYQRGPFYASAAYEFFDQAFWASQDGAIDMVHGQFATNETKWRLGLGLLDWNGISLTGIYESQENVRGMPLEADASRWQIQAGYTFGNNQLKAMYGSANLGACADPWNIGYLYTCGVGKLAANFGDLLTGLGDQQNKQTWALGLDHNFSRRTKVYALYTAVDDEQDEADWSGFSLGMMHRF